MPFATDTGWPVHVPHKCRSGDPAVSQTSSPTMLHVDPEPFVHDTDPELDVAPPLAAFHVIVDPPAVYPVPVSSVMFDVAVGAVVPSRIFVAVTVV